MITVEMLVEELEKRYPNDVFVLNEAKDKEEYITKVYMVEEIKHMIGVKDGK